jgi:transposase-like protein
MQLEKAKKLEKAWGKQPCDHPDIEKEYYLGSDTGDYVCTTCGKSFSDRETWWESREKNANS